MSEYSFYTDEQVDWLKKNCDLYNLKDLSNEFYNKFGVKRGWDAIGYKLNKMGIHKRYPKMISEEKISFLTKLGNGGISTKEIARLFNEKFNENKSIKQINSILNRKNISHKNSCLKYTDEEYEFIENCYKSGVASTEIARLFKLKFGKDIPLATIQRQAKRFMNDEERNERFLDIRFKKDGYEYTEKRTGKVFIKVNGEYVPKALYVWEKANGKKPEGYRIMHIDGDKSNNNIENLRCVDLRVIPSLIGSKMYGCKELSDIAISIVETELLIKDLQKR